MTSDLEKELEQLTIDRSEINDRIKAFRSEINKGEIEKRKAIKWFFSFMSKCSDKLETLSPEEIFLLIDEFKEELTEK